MIGLIYLSNHITTAAALTYGLGLGDGTVAVYDLGLGDGTVAVLYGENLKEIAEKAKIVYICALSILIHIFLS